MRSTTSVTVDAESTTPTLPPPCRDRFLDVVRAIALARVVAWHTWSAAWLTWFPAMPAMFFASGALLDDSLANRGWRATTVSRFRRLLPPFWVYGAVSVTVMVVSGWRPTASELIGWVVPVVDPVGSQELRGLWIPLWYVRAYVWFVLGAAVMRRMVRVVGLGAPLVFALATVALWSAEHRAGQELVPLEVLDACSYGTFVVTGMLYAQRFRRVPGTSRSLVAAVVLGAVAVVSAARFGPSDLVVNRSALLTVLVGGAGLALMVALRPLLAAVGGRPGLVVDMLVRRSLTIYLWHGFGLVVAAELIDAHLDPGPLRWVASLAVVVVVTSGCVVLFGWVEDRAARRRSTRRRSKAVPGELRRVSGGAVWVRHPVSLSAARTSTRPVPASTARSSRRPVASSSLPPGPIVQARRWGTATFAVALVAVALLGSTDGAPVAEPLSGKAVVARAGLLDTTTTTTSTTAAVPTTLRTPRREIEAWLARHPDLQTEPGLTRINGSLVSPDGRASVFTWSAGHDVVVTAVDPVGGTADRELRTWWSMTKTATAVWLLRASEAGQVDLEDRLSVWVPEAPNADSITLEQLARHQSGIPSEVDDSLFVTSPVGVLRRYVASPELAFEPGSGFA